MLRLPVPTVRDVHLHVAIELVNHMDVQFWMVTLLSVLTDEVVDRPVLCQAGYERLTLFPAIDADAWESLRGHDGVELGSRKRRRSGPRGRGLRREVVTADVIVTAGHMPLRAFDP